MDLTIKKYQFSVSFHHEQVFYGTNEGWPI
jgi:hypothetical protein